VPGGRPRRRPPIPEPWLALRRTSSRPPAQGFATDVRFDPAQDGVVVDLTPSTAAAASELFEAIRSRQSTRLAFNGTPIAGRHCLRDDRRNPPQNPVVGSVRVLVVDAFEVDNVADGVHADIVHRVPGADDPLFVGLS